MIHDGPRWIIITTTILPCLEAFTVTVLNEPPLTVLITTTLKVSRRHLLLHHQGSRPIRWSFTNEAAPYLPT
jgi:hypothetical protein